MSNGRIATVWSAVGWLSRAEWLSDGMMRVAIAVVFQWIGGVRFAEYEADTQWEWQRENRTYWFSTGLGIVEIGIGLLVLSGFASITLGAAGAMLAFTTSLVTLSFLFTTPEVWVSALSDAEHGFPYLPGAGRLVLKDVTLLAGGVLLMDASDKAILQRR